MPENPMDAVTWNFTQEQFLQALDDAKHEQAKAIEEHCSKARALKTKVSDEEGEASNSKFAAGASAFVGAYGGIDDFLAGLDAIGLPHPRISDGMFAEFNRETTRTLLGRRAITEASRRCQGWNGNSLRIPT
jgi:hypothetical protein